MSSDPYEFGWNPNLLINPALLMSTVFLWQMVHQFWRAKHALIFILAAWQNYMWETGPPVVVRGFSVHALPP